MAIEIEIQREKEEFIAQTLGDIFRPITKTYASFLAQLVSPHHPDIKRMYEIYETLEQPDKTSYQKSIKWLMKERANFFNIQIYKKYANDYVVSREYFEEFFHEFGFGPLYWPVSFGYTSYPRPTRKLSFRTPEIKIRRIPQLGNLLKGLSKKKKTHLLPPPQQYVPHIEAAITASIGFDNGVYILAKLSPTDIVFQTTMVYMAIEGKKAHPGIFGEKRGWTLPFDFNISVSSSGIAAGSSDLSMTRIKVRGERIREELLRYANKLPFMHEISKALGQLGRNLFTVNFAYSPATGDKDARFIIYSTFVPEIRKYGQAARYRKLRKATFKWVYEDRMDAFIRPIVMSVLQQVFDTLNPDVIERHIWKTMYRQGEFRNLFEHDTLKGKVEDENSGNR